MNRKTFIEKSLQTAGVLTLLAQASRPADAADPKPKEQGPSFPVGKATILGGGLAGLYAANLLKDSGYSVQILEGSNRLGGRIHTYRDEKLGISQDLGGEWIGQGQSDILALAKQLGLSWVQNPYAPLFRLAKEAEDLGLSLQPASRETLSRLIDLHRSLPLAQKQGLDKIDFLSYAKYQGVLEDDLQNLNKTYQIFYGLSLDHLSSDSVLTNLSGAESGLRADYSIVGGADKIIQGLKSKFAPNEILLGDPATKVSQLKSGVQVETASGKVFRSQLLVCTLPAKAVLEIKWLPSLPKDLLFSFLRTQYGKIQKNLVICEKTAGMEPQIHLTEGPGQMVYIGSESAIGNDVVAVTSLTTGDRATTLERSSEETKKNLLKVSLSDLKTKSKWTPESSDSFVFSDQGLHQLKHFVSISLPGSLGNLDLNKKSFDRVFFAGEHFTEQNGTMNGAVTSAIQAVSLV